MEGGAGEDVVNANGMGGATANGEGGAFFNWAAADFFGRTLNVHSHIVCEWIARSPETANRALVRAAGAQAVLKAALAEFTNNTVLKDEAQAALDKLTQ